MKNGVKNIQAVAYNGGHTVYPSKGLFQDHKFKIKIAELTTESSIFEKVWHLTFF